MASVSIGKLPHISVVWILAQPKCELTWEIQLTPFRIDPNCIKETTRLMCKNIFAVLVTRFVHRVVNWNPAQQAG